MRSAAAASTCPASFSAAATSAASARPPRSSAPARPRTRRTRCSMRRGKPESRRTTRPMRTAAAAASRTSGAGCATQGPEVRERIVLTTKTFNPMSEGADSGLAPGADPAADRLEPRAARRRRESISTFPTRWTRRRRSRRRSAPSSSSSPRGRSAPTAAATSTSAWLEEALRHGSPAWAQNGFSLLEQGDRETGGLPAVCREHDLGYTPFSPLAGRLADGEVPARCATVPAGSRMTLRPEPYESYPLDRQVFDALETLEHEAERARHADGGRPGTRVVAGPAGDHGDRCRAEPGTAPGDRP